jgi:hypothetical protein
MPRASAQRSSTPAVSVKCLGASFQVMRIELEREPAFDGVRRRPIGDPTIAVRVRPLL